MIPFVRKVEGSWDGGWTAHAGLMLELGVDAKDALHSACTIPRPFPHPPRPLKQADPGSKRSQRQKRPVNKKPARVSKPSKCEAAPLEEDADPLEKMEEYEEHLEEKAEEHE
eukprot:8172285-Pyramimonas_sp.AAC.1